jgi:hypothetical protein
LSPVKNVEESAFLEVKNAIKINTKKYEINTVATSGAVIGIKLNQNVNLIYFSV